MKALLSITALSLFSTQLYAAEITSDKITHNVR